MRQTTLCLLPPLFRIPYHEIGHFFNLSHVDNITPELQELYKHPTGPYWQLGTARPFVNDVTVNGVEYTSLNTGDFLPTNADPGVPLCPTDACSNLCPSAVTDPFGNHYAPDFMNLMKGDLATNTCNPKVFHQSQKDLMYTVLTNHPSRINLAYPNAADCKLIPDEAFGVKGCQSPQPNIPNELHGHTLSIFDSYSGRTTTSSFEFPSGRYDLDSHGLSGTFGSANSTVYCKTADWLEGVSAADIVRMQQHILFVKPFTNPYQYLSGDLNYSGTISTADNVALRKLILGVEYPTVNNWRFVPSYYFDPIFDFESSFNSNPLTAVWNNRFAYKKNVNGISYMDTYSISLDDPLVLKQSSWNWKATKSGDVNCDADPTNFTDTEDDRSLAINVHRCFNTDEVVKFRIKAIAGTDVQAWQMGYSVDPTAIELLTIENGNNIGTPISFSPENFGTNRWQNGEFRALWVDDYLATGNMGSEKELFQLRIKLKQPTCNFDSLFLLSDKVLATKFYTDSSEINNVSILLDIEEVNAGSHGQLIKNIYPNPFDRKISIEFEIEKEGTVEINLFDNAGRLLKSKREFCNKGINTITFEDSNGFQQGIIHYQIQTGEAFQRGTILNTKL